MEAEERRRRTHANVNVKDTFKLLFNQHALSFDVLSAAVLSSTYLFSTWCRLNITLDRRYIVFVHC